MNKLLEEEFAFAENILEGYTALVCGASKGIGKATAQMLARSGARVVVCARNETELNNVVSGCLLYTSPSPRDMRRSRMPSSA